MARPSAAGVQEALGLQRSPGSALWGLQLGGLRRGQDYRTCAEEGGRISRQRPVSLQVRRHIREASWRRRHKGEPEEQVTSTQVRREGGRDVPGRGRSGWEGVPRALS